MLLVKRGNRVVDDIDEERATQREEFLKREQFSRKIPSQKSWSKKPGKPLKPKVLTFEQKLELTMLIGVQN